MNEENKKQTLSDRLNELSRTTKIMQKTTKQIIRENYQQIEACLAKNYNYDEITSELNNDDEICITVATLRRYIYDIRKERSE